MLTIKAAAVATVAATIFHFCAHQFPLAIFISWKWKEERWNENETKNEKKVTFLRFLNCSTNELWNDLPVEIQRRVRCIQFFTIKWGKYFTKCLKIIRFKRITKGLWTRIKNKFNGDRESENINRQKYGSIYMVKNDCCYFYGFDCVVRVCLLCVGLLLFIDWKGVTLYDRIA